MYLRLSHFFGLIMLLFFVSACRSHQPAPEAPPAPPVVATPPPVDDGFSVRTYNVSGMVMLSKEYCGGAAPSQQDMAINSMPQVYRDKTLYVRQGTRNRDGYSVIREFTTDSEGRFSFAVPPGTYCIIDGEQVEPLDVSKYVSTKFIEVAGDDCLRAWWAECLTTVTLTNADVSGVLMQFHQRCYLETFNPCLQWTGPLPE